MNAHHPARANAIALTASALLGLGMLAGCTSAGSSAAPPTAAASAGRATPTAGSHAAAAPALPATRLLSAAIAAVRAGGSVHMDITGKAAGHPETVSADATNTGGRQVITYGTGHATVLLIDGVGYVQADAQTLEGIFQATQAQAEQAAGQWVSLRPGEKLGLSTYDDVTAGITLSSIAQQMEVSGVLSKTAPTTVDGQAVIGVLAPLPASDGLPGAKLLLYVTDNAALRPVREELVGGGSTTNTVTFSRWGKRVRLTAPPNAIPASSITDNSVTA
jgi:hypothetical protein